MWNIHGKIYDLTEFKQYHPGGSLILDSVKGDRDATAAFESYHAMSDIDRIKSIMEKYRIDDFICNQDFIFKNNGFYYTLKNKVKLYFKKNNIDHHASYVWYLKSIVQYILYFSTFITACYFKNYSIFERCILNMISGHMFIQYGFCVMHDGSHSAISKNYRINETMCRIWNSLSLWDNQIWLKHHCYRHHSYTGSKYDPDTIHFKPFIRKSTEEDYRKYWNYSNIIALMTTCIFPGMWLGQSLVYLRALISKRFWRIKLTSYNLSIIETGLKLFTLVSLIYSYNFLVAFSFIISCNVTYFMCIVPDHDQYETHNNIEHDYSNKDWGEIQVRNSGNFATNNPLINFCFGGINYQIEHHLFPTISHVHFPQISKIVKETCKEYNIPYIESNSIYSAVSSSLKNFSNISKKN